MTETLTEMLLMPRGGTTQQWQDWGQEQERLMLDAVRVRNEVRQQLDRVQATLTNTTQLAADNRRLHREDIQTVATMMIEEANERGMCEDYDQFVERVNEKLHVELERRTKEWNVTATVEFVVTAANEDDAIEQAKDSCDGEMGCWEAEEA